MIGISESEQGNISKNVYHLVLPFPVGGSPLLYMNPYTLLNQLNKHIKGKYDMQIVHVKYFMVKNQQQKRLNDIYIDEKIFQINPQYNNIFSLEAGQTASQFMKNCILCDVDKLKPPADYSPEEFEKAVENQLQDLQMQRLKSLKKKIDLIMGFYNDKKEYKQFGMIKSIESFKQQFNKQYFKSGDFKIFAKAVMNKPVFEKLKEDSRARQKRTQIIIKTKQGKQAKVYLNPNNDSSTYQMVNDQYRINHWSLNTMHEQNFISYFGTDDLKQKMDPINKSVNFVSSISFLQRQARPVSFSIMTFMWNETVMKITVNLAQIKKIQRASVNNQHEFYFHLTHPPMFYLSQLKQDEANIEKFIKFTDRVTNFVFLQNQKIRQNQFLRYFLFNNSILRIKLIVNNQLLGGAYYPVSQTFKKLQNICNAFKGTIKIQPTYDKFFKSKYRLKTLDNKMSFKTLNLITMQQLSKESQDKLWIIKYLILVMVRQNYIIPTSDEIGNLIKYIESDKKQQNLDCYLYVLWRTATNMWGYQDQKVKFVQYFKNQSEQVKKMNVKNIMQRILNASDSIVYIFRATLTPSGIMYNPPTPQMKGRLLKQFFRYSQFFLRVSLGEQSQIELKNQKYITKMYFRNYMEQLQVFGRNYEPLGWSPSQLRSFSLWYFHKTSQRKYKDNKISALPPLERRFILHFLGDFSQIQNYAKRAARIGQSFSSSWTYNSKDIKYQIIDDIYSSENINFTDGIGKISEDLIEGISLNLRIKDLSVIQIRYLGAKGILVLDSDLNKKTMQLRKSMIKYPCQDKDASKYLDILDWNKYKAGFLNRQIIILLRTLGIQNVVFSTVQEEHIKRIEKMTFKDCSIFKYMGDDLNTEINNLQPANKTILSLINAGFQLQKQPFFRGLLQILKKNGYYQLKVKSNIRIQKSARIIGIVDQDGILQQNEVYCSTFDPVDLEPVRTVVQGPAIITRNPCLHPADIRIVNCIGKKQIAQRFEKIGKKNKFKDLWNVVIMPIKGKYPLTSQISGSDLDGDNFFVCWDDRLIPKAAHQAVLIDQPSPNKPNKAETKNVKSLTQKQTYNKMLDFFIDYTNYEKLGQIDNSHLIHADRDLVNFANNKSCLKLAEIHGKAVDFPKTGYCPPVSSDLFCNVYPDFMEKQNALTYISQSILGKLYRDIKNKISTLLERQVYDNVTQIDKSLIYNYKFDQTQQELKSCISVLRQYEREITNLISLLGVDTQYEIYSGNFSAVKKNLKVFGKNRLISSILALKQRFFDEFFTNLPDDEKIYKQTGYEDKHMKIPRYFSDQARRQAQIYYLTSYILKFPQIKETIQGLGNFRQKVTQGCINLKIINKQQKYCGFVWFIIPKLILNLKISSKAEQNGQVKYQDQILEQKPDKDNDDSDYM